MFIKKKVEAVSFHDFMAGNHHPRKHSPRTKNVCAMSSFFPAITPGSFFPIHDTGFALFLVGVGTIACSALFQHFTAKSGSTQLSDTIATISRFVFPVVVYGAIFYFFFTL
jgi:hypothetical protein